MRFETMRENLLAWIKDEATDIELRELINAVNSYDGSLEDYVFYYMDELDDIFYDLKPTELLSRLASDFDYQQEGWRDTLYGTESCDLSDVMDEARKNAEEVADAVLSNWHHIDIPSSLENYME